MDRRLPVAVPRRRSERTCPRAPVLGRRRTHRSPPSGLRSRACIACARRPLAASTGPSAPSRQRGPGPLGSASAAGTSWWFPSFVTRPSWPLVSLGRSQRHIIDTPKLRSFKEPVVADRRRPAAAALLARSLLRRQWSETERPEAEIRGCKRSPLTTLEAHRSARKCPDVAYCRPARSAAGVTAKARFEPARKVPAG